MLDRMRGATAGYSRQFWVLFWGMLIQSIGFGLFWPFMTIYLRERLAVPLTIVALLFTLNAVMGVISTSIAGPIVDRFGRKRAMVVSLIGSSLVVFGMSQARTLGAWVVLMGAWGAAMPLYRIGADAMVADLTGPERRPGAYALLRMANNIGFAVGPAAGGFMTGVSYTLAFYVAAAAPLLFVLLVLTGVRETLPQRQPAAAQSEADAGYGPVLRDRRFMAFCGIYALGIIPSVLVMMLLAVYAKENFAVVERQYGFIMATNAAMVVFFQFPATRVSQRYAPLKVVALGMALYGLGAGSVALGSSFWAFWLSMVILTTGELLLMPTATAVAANLAPADMRGRYMGLFGLAWGVAFGIGPVIGGWLSDNVAPVAIWYAGLVLGLGAAAAVLLLARWRPPQPVRTSLLSE
jgi:MFS family permease